MSKPLGPGSIRRSIAGKWQLPLLFCSVLLLGAALATYRPSRPEPTFEESVKQIKALQTAGFYPESAQLIEHLLGRNPPDHEAAQLRRLLAHTVYLAERRASRPNPSNAQQIILNHTQATRANLPPTAADLLELAGAYEWLHQPTQAVAHYRQVLDLGYDRPNVLRRKIIELLAPLPNPPTDQIDEQIDQILADAQTQPDDLIWAVERKTERLLQEGQLQPVRDLLRDVQASLRDTPFQSELDYLIALTSYKAGDYDQAERLLRHLRSSLSTGSDLAAKTGWLLGRLDYEQGRPQYALSVFEDVLRSFAEGPYVAASKLGRAECLAALERYEEAAEAYAEVVGLVEEGRAGRLVDAVAVQASLRSLHEALREQGRLAEALRFVELAPRLVGAEDVETLTLYLGLGAGLHEQLGQAARERAGAAGGEGLAPSREALLAAAKSHFAAAGDLLLRVAKLNTLREPVAAEAAWRAARNLDSAGQIDRVIAVLEGFIGERPGNPQVPEAMFRLAQAYQAQEQPSQAIAWYRRLLQTHPRTLAASDAYVPLAQCYVTLGPEHYRQAEKVLRMVVEEDPAGPGLHTPMAPQFREALLRLGELYARLGEHAQAISRLEDFLRYYPQDERGPVLRFILAESYRKSGLALLAQAGQAMPFTARETLLNEFRERLEEAARLYDQVIAAYEGAAAGGRSARDGLYLELSYLYRADCHFDLGRYEQAIPCYELAAYRYQDEPAALSAYVQIIHCYQRLGQLERARTALERARWLLRRMPPEQFGGLPRGMGPEQWQEVLAWVEKSGLLED